MKRRYNEEWDDVPSVTQVLGIITSPGLIAWFKNTSPADIKATSEKSLNIGNTVHKIIDDIEKGQSIEIVTQYPDEVKNAVNGYFQWKKDKHIKNVESEVKFRNEDYKGTFDRVCKSDGKLLLIDWKTSKKIYDEAILQACAYARLYFDNRQEFIDEIWIIRLGKEKAEFEPYLISRDERDTALDVFYGILKAYKWLNRKEKNNG